MEASMDEREYQQLADAALAEIEARLDSADIDYEIAAGGILQIDLDDGSQIVINKQSAAREIWVAARSGGFHYRWNGVAWQDTRSDEELHAALVRLTRA
jgi:CyaY protein